MPRKQPLPSKRNTVPDMRRPSGPAHKSKRSNAADTKTSGTRSRKPPRKADASGATVDEVTADLSKDPRREADDD